MPRAMAMYRIFAKGVMYILIVLFLPPFLFKIFNNQEKLENQSSNNDGAHGFYERRPSSSKSLTVVDKIRTVDSNRARIKQSVERGPPLEGNYPNHGRTIAKQTDIDLVYLWVNGSDVDFLLDLKRQKLKDKRLSFVRCTLLLRKQSGIPVIVLHPALSVSNDMTNVLHLAGISSTSAFNMKSEDHIFTIVLLQNTRDVDRILSQEIVIGGSLHVGFCGSITHRPTVLTKAELSSHFFVQSKQSIKTPIHRSREMELFRTDFNISKDHITNVQNEDTVLVSTKTNADTKKIKEAFLPNLVLSPAFLGWDYFDFTGNKAVTPNRVIEKDELRFSLRSVEKFAPWIRHIYIVTNQQTPFWMNTSCPGITIVSTFEIFPNKSHLPSFNSAAIEGHLYQIRNLSQRFLFMCDDFLFGQNISYADFNTEADGFKLYFEGIVQECAIGCYYPDLGTGVCDEGCNNAECQYDHGDCGSTPDLQTISSTQADPFTRSIQHTYGVFNKVFGYRYRRMPTHMPILFDKKIADEMHKRFGRDLDFTSSNHFRSVWDMQYSFSYNNFLMEAREPATPTNIFDAVDTDHSGYLSYTEMLALPDILQGEKIYITKAPIPKSVTAEEIVKQCLNGDIVASITRRKFLMCPFIRQTILSNRPTINKYRYTRINDRDKNRLHSFVILSNNVALIEMTFKRILQHPVKFIAVNDDLRYYDEHSAAQANKLLKQFYNKLLPTPSRFERTDIT